MRSGLRRALWSWRRELDRAERARPTQADELLQLRDVAHAADHWVNLLSALRTYDVSDVDRIAPADLSMRRSSRPTRRATLDDAIWLLSSLGALHDQGVDGVGREWQSKLNPSAGGTHSILPLLFHDSRWYRNGPGIVAQVQLDARVGDRFLADADEASGKDNEPFSYIFAIADPRLLLQRYPRGSSLLWRDAGAFLATAHLAAGALGLPSVIIGTASAVGRLRSTRQASVLGAVGFGSGP